MFQKKRQEHKLRRSILLKFQVFKCEAHKMIKYIQCVFYHLAGLVLEGLRNTFQAENICSLYWIVKWAVFL